MAVVTLYMSDKDPEQRMFKSKKEADEHDKKLELAENLAAFLTQNLENIDDDLADQIGMLFANNKDALQNALKGKPEELLTAEPQDTAEDAEQDERVVALAKK